MNSPRIRHLVQPTVSVVDRNVSVTNEVRTIMTTAAVPVQTSRQAGLELLVSRLAVGMLRWSQRRTERRTQHRADSRRITHEQMQLLRRAHDETAAAADLARLG